MMNNNVRLKQRYENLVKSYSDLKDALAMDSGNKIVNAAVIKFFEMTFELSWNVMKDILEYRGFQNVSSPRASIKMSFQSGIIEDGADWINCLESRNLTAHTYNEAIALEVDRLVRTKYFSMIEKFIKKVEDIDELKQ